MTNETQNQDSIIKSKQVNRIKEEIMFGIATRFVLQNRFVGVPYLGHNLNIKFSHAEDLIEEMQEKGFVSEPAENGQREVFGIKRMKYNQIYKTEKDWEKRLFLWADIYEIDESDFPRDKAKLISMTALNLSGYNMVFIPAEIGLLTQLEEINLSNNNIREFPEILLHLVHLRLLNLEYNQFDFLPVDRNEITQFVCMHCTTITRVHEIVRNEDLLALEFQKWKDKKLRDFPAEIKIMQNRGCEILFSTLRYDRAPSRKKKLIKTK